MFEGLEKRVNKKGGISYWDGDVIVGKRCTECGEDKEINCFEIRDKEKNTYRGKCKECKNEYRRKFYSTHEHVKEKRKQYRETHKEFYKEFHKQWYEDNKETLKERQKRYYEDNKEQIKERERNYRYKNKERINERKKRYNKEHFKRLSGYWKQYRKEHSEHYKEYNKEYNEKIKQENIEYLTSILKQLNPLFKELNIKPYGSIYKVTHKNGHCYIGQTIHSLKERYGVDVIQGWIEERKEKENQKFVNELIKNDLTIEIIDVGICKWHLDKLEAYWIDFYNSFQDGYNNNSGYYKRDDGIEEFENILNKYGLECINGELRRICDE